MLCQLSPQAQAFQPKAPADVALRAHVEAAGRTDMLQPDSRTRVIDAAHEANSLTMLVSLLLRLRVWSVESFERAWLAQAH
jgi:hypothetical protein